MEVENRLIDQIDQTWGWDTRLQHQLNQIMVRQIFDVVDTLF
jgi:hypothetical protein